MTKNKKNHQPFCFLLQYVQFFILLNKVKESEREVMLKDTNITTHNHAILGS